jgi:hypothetical protein
MLPFLIGLSAIALTDHTARREGFKELKGGLHL